MHYIQGEDRAQVQLYSSLEDLLAPEHYVRLIDMFVDHHLQESLVSIHNKGQQEVGRRAYHPSMMVKLYMYSYLNGISSSRKIEKECHRNLELIWLNCNLKPDHKTISDFRRENKEGISFALKKFTGLLKEHGYISGKTISIDGSKIRANAGRCISLESIASKIDDIESQLGKYLDRLEQLDQVDDEIERSKEEKGKLEGEITKLRKEVKALKSQKEQLESKKAKKMSPVDPDARIMKSRNGKHFCYNFQSAVDGKHQFIAGSFVSPLQNDRHLLVPMVSHLGEHYRVCPEEVLADAGYYVRKDIEFLEKEKGIECFVAINHNQQTIESEKSVSGFTYDQTEDKYTCPEGNELPFKGTKKDNRRGTLSKKYVCSGAPGCKRKSRCTSARARTIYRLSNQDWVEKYAEKMSSNLGVRKLNRRKALSEHPFGTIKYWMGQIPLKLRGIKNVQIETDLYVLAYNFKRLLNIEDYKTIEQIMKGNYNMTV